MLVITNLIAEPFNNPTVVIPLIMPAALSTGEIVSGFGILIEYPLTSSSPVSGSVPPAIIPELNAEI